MLKQPNLLIVAGTGRNSGKTTLACKIISQSDQYNIVAVKISPHRHDPVPTSVLIHSGKGFEIFLEKVYGEYKDTERMLSAGAAKAYYIQAVDNAVIEAFRRLLSLIPEGEPIICESPVLRKFIEPSLFIITDSRSVQNRKETTGLEELADLKVSYEERQTGPGIISFADGRWFINR